MKIITIILLIILSSILDTAAQQNFTLYNFDAVPQTVFTNPAIIPRARLTIGIPIITSIHISSCNSAFKPDDLLRERPQDDSLNFDIDNVIAKLTDDNFISTDLSTEIIFVGFKLKKGYLSFGVNHNLDLRFDYPADLIKYLWHGNGYFLEKNADFSNTNLEINHYLSYHIGYSYPINDKLTIGSRIKFLNGMANISVERMSVSMFTTTNPQTSYTFRGNSDIKINTSGFYDDEYYKDKDYIIGEENNFDLNNYIFGKKNNGFAFDFGANYKINDKFNISASIVDLGFINWKSNVKNFTSKNSTFNFDGIYFDENNDSTDFFNAYLDTLSDIFEINKTYNKYKTNLHTRYYLNGNYVFDSTNSIGLLLYGRSIHNKLEPAIGLNYNRRLGKAVDVKLSYSIYNNMFDIIGLGFSANIGPIQTYLIEDDVLMLFKGYNINRFNIRFGINVSLWKKRKIKPAETNEESYEPEQQDNIYQ